MPSFYPQALVFLGPLGLGYIFLTLLLFLLLTVPCLNHLGQFPGQQCTGDEERRESQYDSGEETVGVFGSPFHDVLCPRPKVNHPGQQQGGLIKPVTEHQERGGK